MEYVANSVTTYNTLAKVAGKHVYETIDEGGAQAINEAVTKLITASTKTSIYNTLQSLFFPVVLMGFTLSRSDIGLVFKVFTTIIVIAHVMTITHQNFGPSVEIR